jgi:hypothetical protein
MSRDELIKSFSALAKSQEALGKQAVEAYKQPVEHILRIKSQDVEAIERLLEGMPDFCFNDDILLLYRKLCRHFFDIDPQATAYYVYAYRDRWDAKSEDEQEGK